MSGLDEQPASLVDSYEFEWKSEWLSGISADNISSRVEDYLNENAVKFSNISVQYVLEERSGIWTAFITYKQLKKKDK
jgi:hypothetical protein